MKQQIANRLGAAHVRDTVMQFVDGSMTREQAMESLGVGKTRLYELRTSFLAARAAGESDKWEPSRSGGNHMPEVPEARPESGRGREALFVRLCGKRGGPQVRTGG